MLIGPEEVLDGFQSDRDLRLKNLLLEAPRIAAVGMKAIDLTNIAIDQFSIAFNKPWSQTTEAATDPRNQAQG